MRRNLTLTLLILLAVIKGYNSVYGQGFSETDLSSLKEELIMELNNSIYIPGENILISLSVLNKGLPSAISEIAYVELISEDKSVVIQEKAELRSALGSASIYLPSYIKTGSYTFIAYTKWMKNYPVDLIPQKSITIINPYEKLPSGLFIMEDKLKVKAFFQPESGYFIPNVSQKVGYQVLDQFGNGIPFSGKLTDSKGELIVSFDSEDHGSGTFQLTPIPGESYQAIIIDSFEKIHFFPIKTKNEGSFQAILTEDEDSFTFSRGKDLSTSEKYFEIWDPQGQLCSKEKLGTTHTLLKEKLPKGLIQFRVVNSNNIEVYRRSIFNTPRRIKVELKLTKSTYNTREEVFLEIHQKDPGLLNDLHVSIREILKSDDWNFPQNYFSKSIITKTNWPDKKMPGLNHVIVTQQQQLEYPANAQPAYLPDLHGEILRGSVTNKNHIPFAHADISMSTLTPIQWDINTSITNANGEFFINLKPSEFQGNSIFYISDTSQPLDLTLEEPFLTDHSFVAIKPFSFSQNTENWLLQRSISVQVENAYYEQKKLDPITTSPSFQSNLSKSKTYILDEFTRFPTVEDVVREYIAEVWLRKNGDPSFSFPYVENPSYPVDSALVLLNGIPVTPSFILAMNQADIERIDLFKEQLKVGPWEYRGVINFGTYSKNVGSLNLPSNYKPINFPRATPYKEYSAPKHLKDSLSRIPDFRSQLAWVPHLKLSPDHKIAFQTSDKSGDFEIILSGVTSSGEFISERLEFEVINQNVSKIDE